MVSQSVVMTTEKKRYKMILNYFLLKSKLLKCLKCFSKNVIKQKVFQFELYNQTQNVNLLNTWFQSPTGLLVCPPSVRTFYCPSVCPFEHKICFCYNLNTSTCTLSQADETWQMNMSKRVHYAWYFVASLQLILQLLW